MIKENKRYQVTINKLVKDIENLLGEEKLYVAKNEDNGGIGGYCINNDYVDFDLSEDVGFEKSLTFLLENESKTKNIGVIFSTTETEVVDFHGENVPVYKLTELKKHKGFNQIDTHFKKFAELVGYDYYNIPKLNVKTRTTDRPERLEVIAPITSRKSNLGDIYFAMDYVNFD